MPAQQPMEVAGEIAVSPPLPHHADVLGQQVGGPRGPPDAAAVRHQSPPVHRQFVRIHGQDAASREQAPQRADAVEGRDADEPPPDPGRHAAAQVEVARQGLFPLPGGAERPAVHRHGVQPHRDRPRPHRVGVARATRKRGAAASSASCRASPPTVARAAAAFLVRPMASQRSRTAWDNPRMRWMRPNVPAGSRSRPRAPAEASGPGWTFTLPPDALPFHTHQRHPTPPTTPPPMVHHAAHRCRSG